MSALVFWIFLAISIEGLGKDHLGEKDSGKEKEKGQEGSKERTYRMFLTFQSLTEVWKIGT